MEWRLSDAARTPKAQTRIIRALEASDERPLWVAAWGGSNTLAQALWTIRNTRSGPEAKRLISKLRVYTISDQDDTGPWIRKEFPELFYIVSPGGYGAATWTGINTVVEGIDNTTISNDWLSKNIQQGHGPLGSAYPDVAYGLEGDTPTFLGLIANGLNTPEHPDWGGWGGRYTLRLPERSTLDPNGFTGGVPIPQETRPIWTNAVVCDHADGPRNPTAKPPVQANVPLQAFARPFGAGATISKTTLPPAWIGQFETRRTPITRPSFVCSLGKADRPFGRCCSAVCIRHF